MEIFPILLVIVVIVCTIIVFRQQAKKSAHKAAPQRPEQKQEEDKSDSVWKQLNPLTARLQEEYSNSGHPSAMLVAPTFQQTIKLLKEPRFKFDEIANLAISDIPHIASLSLAVLSEREDSEDASEKIFRGFSGDNSFVMYFVLKYLAKKNVHRSTARIIAKVQYWWSENAVAVQNIQEHTRERHQKGEVIQFEDELKGFDEEHIVYLEQFLDKLGLSQLRKLRDQIREYRAKKVDTQYLRSVGTLIERQADNDIVVHEDLAHCLTQAKKLVETDRPKSMIILGESGVGKSCLAELISQCFLGNDWLVFVASASDVIAGQKYIGELEERTGQLVKNLGIKKKVVWFVGSFDELAIIGKHKYSATSVLDILIPHILNGQLVLVGESTPKAFQRLSQSNPRLASSLEKLELPILDPEQSSNVATEWLAGIKDEDNIRFKDYLIKEASDLANQYLDDKAAPGNLIHLLRSTIDRLKADKVTSITLNIEEVIVTLSKQTGLPKSMLDDRDHLNLEALNSHFKKRVKGQPEAVSCLVERVAMIKAGLTDPSRPTGVFLFVGPSGTGKTEIAKALASFLFGSDDRMIRLDMSEFQSISSLSKLLGGGDDNDSSESLISKIRKQPFSVVLLDEFEKAHPNVWDLFLQVFDDGRLTDNRGYTVNCRHSMFILTTNIGAKIEMGPRVGFGSSQSSFDSASLQKAVKGTFRPEFINRLDRVVVFQPLGRRVMREILLKELNELLTRRGLRSKQWVVEWGHSAIEFLLEKGFTHDLGARPLKRAIDRYLLSPLATAIVNRRVPEGDQFLLIKAAGDELAVEFIDPDEPLERESVEKTTPKVTKNLSIERLMFDSTGAQAETKYLLGRSNTLGETLKATAWQSRKEELDKTSYATDFWSDAGRFSILGRLQIIDQIESAYETIQSILERLNHLSAKVAQTDLIQRMARQLFLLNRSVSDLENTVPQDAFIQIQLMKDKPPSAPEEIVFDNICKMYENWAENRRMKITEISATPTANKHSMVTSYAVSGFACYSLLLPENGLHLWELPGESTPDPKDRIQLKVVVIAQADKPTKTRKEFTENAAKLFQEKEEDAFSIVRRYAQYPTPLVRDAKTKTRTGRLETVMQGNFDVIEFL